ncbi:MAG TPA: hypothetical protein VFB15_11305 [Candidatus Binataceae bacterium]|jgi:Rod binding domain-containing protein|nr:hypothetical protein [Candidatus Binataceae bacterium]
MSNSLDGIFGRPLIESADQRQQRLKAAQGFTQVFAAILSHQMRESATGEENGPLGIGGGVSGDVYGAFFDQAFGAILAKSPAMSRLNREIVRELGSPRAPATSRAGKRDIDAVPSAAALVANRDIPATASALPVLAAPDPASSAASLDSVAPTMAADSRGPVLLPPEPPAMAFFLPPPSTLTK